MPSKTNNDKSKNQDVSKKNARKAPAKDNNKPIPKRYKNKTIEELANELEEYRAREARYKLLLDNIKDPVQLFDKNGTILYLNKAGAKNLQEKQETIIGNKMNKYLLPKDNNIFLKRLRKNIKSGKKEKHEDSIELPDGIRYFQSDIKSLKDPVSNAPAVHSISYDITGYMNEENKKQESENRFRSLFEGFIHPAIVYDRDGIILMINAPGAKNLGLNQKDCIGKSLKNLLPHVYAFVIERFHEVIDTGKEMVVEDMVELPTGRKWYWSTLQPVFDTGGKAYAVLNMAYEITERKLAEEELKLERDSLNVLMDGLSHTGIGIDVVGVDYTVRLQNKVLEDRFGDFTGKLCYENYMGLKEPCDFCPMKKAIDNKSVESTEIKAVDGRYYELTSAPLPNSDGTVDKAIEVVRDITERKLAEEELIKSEKKYHDLFENVPIGVTVSTLDGKVLEINNILTKLSGFTIEDFNDIDLITIYNDLNDRDKLVELLRKNGKVRDFEVITKRKDGSKITTLMNVDMTTLHDKKVMLSTVRDITKYTQAVDALKESEEKFRIITEQSLFGIGILQDKKYVYMNDAAHKITGYSFEEVINWDPKDFLRLIHPEDVSTVMDEVQKKLEQGLDIVSHYNYRIFDKSGKLKWIENFSKAIEYNGEKADLILFADVTERKNAEEEINKLNEELETRVKERTEELEAANSELESFSFTVSHDLRAPIRHIQAFSELLLKEIDPDHSEKEDHYLEVIIDSTKRMSQLIDGLLTFSRSGRTEFHMEKIDMNLLVEYSVKEFRLEIQDRKIDLNVDDLPETEGDRMLLRQVMINLLSNSIKYTEKKQNSKIEIGSSSDGMGNIVYFVRDNGIGFDMKYSDKLFGVFQRLHSSDDYEGTGIGLATAQKIIQRHGGQIWAESKVGEGTTFYFTIGSVN